MCNCFLGNAENFIFDPKCKPSDTPDCDWHESSIGRIGDYLVRRDAQFQTY